MMGCNVLSPQMFWFRKMRRSLVLTFFMSILINIGMWFERFVIIVTSVYRDYLPSCLEYLLCSYYLGGGLLPGNIRIILHLLFPVAKFFPVIALAEIKHILKTTGEIIKRRWMI